MNFREALEQNEFELVQWFLTSFGAKAKVWRDRVTGHYFSSYVVGSRLILTKPTTQLRFAIDDVHATYYKRFPG